jgi:hypothetical protein
MICMIVHLSDQNDRGTVFWQVQIFEDRMPCEPAGSDSAEDYAR